MRLNRTYLLLFLLVTAVSGLRAQVTASITGVISDPSGARVPSAAVAVKNVETGVIRTTISDDAGRYQMLALPVGEYEIRVSKAGFQEQIRTGIHLAVGQEAGVDLALQVGEVKAQVTVKEDAPIVNTTTRDISGLVGRAAGEGTSLERTQLRFAAAAESWNRELYFTEDRRDRDFQFDDGQQFRGLRQPAAAKHFPAEWRGVFRRRGEQHAAGWNERDAAGRRRGARIQRAARYVQRRPGQTSGRSGDHRDAIGKQPVARLSVRIFAQQRAGCPNFFDQGSAPPFQRNQFGASMGGPIQADKTFLFGNYEGFRQNLHQTSAAFVPDVASRAAAVASIQPLLNLWPTAPAGAPDFNGIAQVFSSPLQTIREDFGTVRLDHTFSQKDSLAAIYTVDDGSDVTATPLESFQHRHRSFACSRC